MTFTTTPPTTPGFYACRTDAQDESRFAVYLFKDREGTLRSEHSFETPQEMNCEWCRLVPAEEVEKLELENIKLLEVARAAKRIGGERIEFEGSEHYAVIIEEVDELDNTLKSLEESGVKI